MAGKKIQSYRDLEIWKMARELVVPVHKMTLEKLPKFEMYEEGSQIRRSSKSISSNIVEGYGRSRYQNEYIKFLTYALASCDETRDHLEMLYDTGSLTDKILYEDLHNRYDILGRKVNNFRQSVIVGHSLRDDSEQHEDAET
ncbi:four helix bundle protein [candidate division KSB1 bacterium]|nr:four helix bundle protein [candidate division KSB1 bacterium]